jgi:tetratricopeptide (TPR) repeat protein
MTTGGRLAGGFLFGLTLLLGSSERLQTVTERLWHHRNLGKAYYENPVTQFKAVEEFKQALELSPKSAREQVNYGLALLRAGVMKEAIAELETAQKTDPSIPHTWFNLGMAYKKEFENERAIAQLEGMLKLVPEEAVAHYNLGVLYKQTGSADKALSHFQAAVRLNPNFAAPHFQLYNAYRESGRADEASRELSRFNEIKKRKSSAAVQEDPEWCFYSEIYDSVDLDREYEQPNSAPPFRFESRKVASGVEPKSAGMAVLDFDGDGQPDLLVWSQNGIIILKNGVTPVARTGLEGLKEVTFVEPGDFNNDGFPDLAVITASGPMLFVNRKGKFEPYSAKLPAGPFTRAVWIDYDHDYDLDLILLGSKSALLQNDGSAGFSDQTSRFPFVSGRAIDASVFDLAPNLDEADLAVLYEDGSLVVYRDKSMGKYEAQPYGSKLPGATGIRAFDTNNDGWTDLIALAPSGVQILENDDGKLKAGTEVSNRTGPVVFADFANRALADVVVGDSIYRNLGKNKFEQVKPALATDPVALAQADFDGDGLSDLAVVTPDGSVELMKNGLTTTNRSIRIQLEGVKNLKIPLGAVVEVKTGAWYQKKMYTGVPLLFGLRAYPEVDTVRITWPNGLIQNEVKQAADKQLAFKEQARLSGSCPMIFAWNGTTFAFVTDVLGVAPLGASNGDGRYFPVNHREYVRIPAGTLKAQDEHYEIRITEELREVSYLDKVQLIAVDHPEEIEVFTNDKFKNPPFPEFRLFGVKRRIYPVSAWDDAGRDVLQRITSRDGKYVDSFHRTDAGVADVHSLILDFGKAATSNRAVLVLNGWVDWPDGSTFLATAQERKEGLVLPSLQVKNAAGQWETVIQDMGMPSGKPKSIVVDLAGKFLSASREVRIVTNLCVYWDEIFLSEDTAAPPVKLNALLTESADLNYRGFSRATITPARTQPEQFDYEKWTPVTMWNPTPGLYTRYGDVGDLVRRVDDRMVIMGAGDELKLLFSARDLPKPKNGWSRDFLLLVDGWAKDSDANTAYGKSVEPLPFHGMAGYPYPDWQHFPDDAGHRNYQAIFNTRPAVPDIAALRKPR